MTNQSIAAKPALLSPPVAPIFLMRATPILRPRQPLLYWRPVAWAAVAGLMLVGAVLLGLTMVPRRSAGSVHVALTKPPAPDPTTPPADATRSVHLLDLLPADPVPTASHAAGVAPLADPSPNPPDASSRALEKHDPPPVSRAPAAPSAAQTPPAAAMCQTFGTSVDFAVSPAAAEKQAAHDGKLVFLLHVSGDFEDDAFT
ncbi:MAG TPA: hypothetical protein VMS17_30630 [Gemmataceae bacterium]|nr:hypothetical protein [Gemmataceae bacterium]